MKIWGGDSDKKDKRVANRKFRRQSKMHAKLSALFEDDKFKYYHIRDVSDTWNFCSDGLAHYFSINNSKYTKEEINKYRSK
jgi:hypothetical protein